MSKIYFLLHIFKKDLLLVPTPTLMAFNITNSPRSYFSSNPSQPNYSSLLRITNPCFLLLGSNPPIAELEFWLAAHWIPDLSTSNFTKGSRF